MRSIIRVGILLSFWCLSQLLYLPTSSLGQPGPGKTIPAGEQITLHSKVLNEDRTILVALPASYASSKQNYPVLYVTDAQFYFDQTRSTAAFLGRERIIPEMIVVGVTNRDRVRDFYATKADFKIGDRIIPTPTSGNADHFLEFIASELIPWVENSYRTSGLRILAGVSAGGYFALHSARMKPGLFQMLVVASPWLAWDDRKELNELLTFVPTPRFQVKGLFLSYANEGPETKMKANVDTLVGALKSRNDPSCQLVLHSYPDETHDTTIFKSYYDGLRAIFDGYAYPRDPKTNLLVGSVADVEAHYAKLGQRLGTTFDTERIVNELGYQYLGQGSVQPAVTAFRFNVEHYPESANAWDSLGEGLERLGNRDEAIASYRKAVALAESNHYPGLETFRAHLQRLTSGAPR
jgi:predicted alpha/beta superfamily hydrolase